MPLVGGRKSDTGELSHSGGRIKTSKKKKETQKPGPGDSQNREDSLRQPCPAGGYSGS